MDLAKITLACQSLKNLRGVKTELEKYTRNASSYEAICLSYILYQRACKKKLDTLFPNTVARKSRGKMNKPLVIIRGLFSGRFKKNTETKYAKILSFALKHNWTVVELSRQLSEKGIAKLHQQYLTEKNDRPIQKIPGFRKKARSITKFKNADENFIVLIGKTTSRSVDIYGGSTNRRIVKMVMRELGLLKIQTKKKRGSV